MVKNLNMIQTHEMKNFFLNTSIRFSRAEEKSGTENQLKLIFCQYFPFFFSLQTAPTSICMHPLNGSNLMEMVHIEALFEFQFNAFRFAVHAVMLQKFINTIKILLRIIAQDQKV